MLTRTALLYLSRQHGLKTMLSMFPGFKQVTRRFIAGENIDDALKAIRELNALGITASFDHLGESISSEAEAESDVVEYLHVLDRIAEEGIASNVSVKPTQVGLDIAEDLCLRNIRRIVEAAARHRNFVRIDMEDSPRTDATLRIFYTLRSEFDNVGIVLQSYLYRTEKDLADVLAVGGRVRLCKGAYNEPENVAFPDKADVDANFIKLMKIILQSGIYHGIATHDEAMINATKEFAERESIPHERWEFQMLFGIRRELQIRLAKAGYGMRTYVPYGEYWYPYFMRRLAERPANIGFVLRNIIKG
ncbi:MAG: proline dehydrogenase family protein [Acidobacteriota bacterium]